ncbi:MAG TPA: alkaline phosphatase family protein [Planctomicrobium sp.]|nr:alkaline phosphatase family protein [Planctomicrobium sp.]
MRNSFWILLSSLLSQLLLAIASDPVLAGEPEVKHVVLISIDGLPASFLEDPAIPLKTIRHLARQGVIAEGMTVCNPSVTWPNHTTLITGARPAEHGVLYNGVLERLGPGLPIQLNSRKDKGELVLIPTLTDLVSAQGGTVAGINWPCTRNCSSLSIDFPDTPEMMKYTTPEFLEELIEAGQVPDDLRESFYKLPPVGRDRVWTDAACYALRKHKPRLTLVHLLNVDASHHRYGPGTWAGHSAVAYADSCVRDILEALDDAGIREQTAVFVVSDHGFISTPKSLNPNSLLRKAGLLTVEGNRITAATAQGHPAGGTAMLFLTRPDTREQDRKRVIELFTGAEGIKEILTPEHFEALGMPLPDEYPQMGDLVLVAEDGYAFTNAFSEDELVTPSSYPLGTHGFLSNNPRMNATFIAAGAGIRQGLEMGLIENIQVAPTIAKLLNVQLESATGAPLDEILTGVSQ